MYYKKFIYVATVTSEYEASNMLGVLFVNGITNYRLQHISGTTYDIIVTKETGRKMKGQKINIHQNMLIRVLT